MIHREAKSSVLLMNIQKKQTFSNALCLGKCEWILHLHKYVKPIYLHSVQLVDMLHIPTTAQFYSPKDPKLDWNFWMASGLRDFKLQMPWSTSTTLK